jgi:hypothetical protein
MRRLWATNPAPAHNITYGAIGAVLRTIVVVEYSTELSSSIGLQSRTTMVQAANNEFSGVALT